MKKYRFKAKCYLLPFGLDLAVFGCPLGGTKFRLDQVYNRGVVGPK